MDSVRSRWPILAYAFMVWTVFGSENTFPAIEFSIGKRAPVAAPPTAAAPLPLLGASPASAVTAPTVPTPTATAPTPGALMPSSVAVAPAVVAPVVVAPAVVAPALPPNGSPPEPVAAARASASSPELAALRTLEESLLRAPATASRPSVLPRPPLAKSCVPGSADRLASRDWTRSLADSWPAGLQYPNLPVANDPRLARYIDYFTNNAEGRKTFTTWLRRSGKYRDLFADILKQRKLPLDLAAVAFVESGLWPTAVSKAGATGLWQFMPETARAYGLQVQDQLDERRSIWRSTEAAADHLRDLFEQLGSWELALAAYNMGYPRLSRVLQDAGTEDFWAVSTTNSGLPRETALYVPKVLAVALVLNNLGYFGFDDVEPLPALDATPIEVPPGVALSDVARAAGTTVRLLRELNPQLPGESTPNLGRAISVYVPRSAHDSTPSGGAQPNGPVSTEVRTLGASDATALTPQGLDWLGRAPSRLFVAPYLTTLLDPSAAQPFLPKRRISLEAAPDRDVAPTDTGVIDWNSWGRSAARTATPSAALPAWRISEGRLTLTPNAPEGTEAPDAAVPLASAEAPATIQYRVLNGDSLWSIAKAYGTSERQIAKDNRLSADSVLNAGRVLEVRSTRTLL